MKNSNNAARQENKKALPKFILTVVLSLALGGVLGFALVTLNLQDFQGVLGGAGLFFTNHVAPWLLIALPVVELAVCLPIYFSGKKQLAAWDGEDESVSNKIEAKLSVCLWVTGLCTVAALFLLAAMCAGFVGNAGTERMMPAPMFFGGLTAFLADLFVPMVLQQKLVDLSKRLNPEKHGSVYDPKFQKKYFFMFIFHQKMIPLFVFLFIFSAFQKRVAPNPRLQFPSTFRTVRNQFCRNPAVLYICIHLLNHTFTFKQLVMTGTHTLKPSEISLNGTDSFFRKASAK